MPRTKRRKSIADFYHIIIRGINREEIFKTERDKEKIIKYLKRKLKEEMEIYAFCIMDNHVHLILHGQLNTISKYMQAAETAYALYYNRKNERTGYVFQNRFKSFPIEEERYLWNCLHYIHLNPVKAGIVLETWQYRYSSAREYLLGRKGLVDQNALQLYNREKIYYPIEKLEAKLEYTLIEDLEEEENVQKEKIVKKWIEQYQKMHQGISIWDIQNLPESRKKFVEIMLDKKIMSERELLMRIKQLKE